MKGRSMRDTLEMAGLTHVGRRRPHNEDQLATDPGLGLAVLADGMGGYRAGEVASAMAVETVVQEVRKGLGKQRPEEMDQASGYTRGSLLVRDAFVSANASVYEAAQTRSGCRGMGTTLISLLFYDNLVSVAHVGDSRLYRLRGHEFEQLTVDHSLMQELVDRGFYSLEEARDSVQRNLVTRAVGVDASVQTDLLEQPVLPGDLFLLCSDGLSDVVDDIQIHLILCQYGSKLAEAAARLVDKANANGGIDNISVVLVRALRPFPARPRARWYTRLLGRLT
jgi:protein phosphatase